MTKKKVILCIVGAMLVFSLITGKSDSRKNRNDYDEGVSETSGDRKEVSEESADKQQPAVKEQAATTEVPLAEKTAENTKDGSGVAPEESSGEEDDAVTPEFKEAMDSYEAFFEEYAEFMKKYSETDDPTEMLMDYSDYMSSYADVMQKMNEIDTEDLSPADYAYYIEVTARIQKKLLEVSE